LALRLGLQHCEPNSRVFDFGCGSGVLAIAVTKILQCESFVFDILVTHSDGKTEAIKGLSEQPNVAECPKGTGAKWCLLDEKTDAVLTKDVKSFKVLVHRFDSTQYFICHDNGNH
jgi:tRNA A58 N-methylase Trm61